MRKIHPTKYRRAFNEVIASKDAKAMTALAAKMRSDEKLDRSDKAHAEGAANELDARAAALEGQK